MITSEFRRLACEYNQQTGIMSFMHMMRTTPGYKQLMDTGLEAVYHIIDGFREYAALHFTDRRKWWQKLLSLPQTRISYDIHCKIWGMSWVLILMDLTHSTPILPDPVAVGMDAWSVDDTCHAWIHWYDNGGMQNLRPCPCGCGADSAAHCWNTSEYGSD